MSYQYWVPDWKRLRSGQSTLAATTVLEEYLLRLETEMDLWRERQTDLKPHGGDHAVPNPQEDANVALSFVSEAPS